MTKGYRRLTAEELKSYGITTGQTKTDKYKHIRSFITKYYDGADRALVVLNSEYNDEGYDISTQGVIVYDAVGNVLQPKAGKEVEAMRNLPEAGFDTWYNDDEPEDFVVMMNPSMPELYIKT